MKYLVCVALLCAVGVSIAQESQQNVENNQESLASIEENTQYQGDVTDGARDKRLIGKLALAKIGVLGLG